MQALGHQFSQRRSELKRRNFPDISTTLNRVVVSKGWMTPDEALVTFPPLSSQKLHDVQWCLSVLFRDIGIQYVPFESCPSSCAGKRQPTIEECLFQMSKHRKRRRKR